MGMHIRKQEVLDEQFIYFLQGSLDNSGPDPLLIPEEISSNHM